MKFNVALSVAAVVGGVVAAPGALKARQSGCPAPTEASCKELHDRCVVQGASVLANPWNNRVCTAAATCYGVGNLLTSYACRLNVNPPAPSSLPALSTSMFPNPTTQQNYIDFYYGSINAAWPSSINVVTGYWSPILSWVNTGSSAPYNNLNDWFHWSSNPTTVTSGPTSTPTPTPTPTPTNTTPTPTPTGCVGPTDATCADIVNGCIAVISNTDPWSQKKCVAAATCFGPQTLLTHATCRTGQTFPTQGNAPALSTSVWSSITGSNSGNMTPQNFVDLIYSSIASAWPSSPDYVKNSWLSPIQSWTNTGSNIPFTNFNNWLHHKSGGNTGTTPAAIPGIVDTCQTGVSLSFDDGPYVWNKNIVDKFDQAGAKATFFVNGDNYDCIYSEDRVRDLRYAYEHGHTIAAHTWFHSHGNDISIDALGKEMDLLEEALWKILGIKPALFRPPYGEYNQDYVDYLNSRGYTVVTWDLDTADSGGASVAQSIANVQNAVGPHSMVLAHETYESSAKDLAPALVDLIQARGYSLKTVDQCLNIQPYQVTGGGYQQRDASWTC